VAVTPFFIAVAALIVAVFAAERSIIRDFTTPGFSNSGAVASPVLMISVRSSI
jgi:hypothetical protein